VKYQYKAKVIKCYDADTITVLVDLGFSISIQETIRLFGINAPEVRGKERPSGLAARDYLRDRILGEDVKLITKKDKKGKYGRYLATVYLGKSNINLELVRKGYAVEKNY